MAYTPFKMKGIAPLKHDEPEIPAHDKLYGVGHAGGDGVDHVVPGEEKDTEDDIDTKEDDESGLRYKKEFTYKPKIKK